MPWPAKSNAQAKKVAPPAIPLTQYRPSTSKSNSYGNEQMEKNDTIFLDDNGFTTSFREINSPLRQKDDKLDKVEYGILATNTKTMNAIGSTYASITVREPLTHKAAVFYHQQLALQEDQGIDLTQSPGRDSPGSSSGSAGSGSRHSTASLDSGRASSYVTSGGTSVRGPFCSPRCSSVSSCSIGSVDRISQRSDNDIVLDWLIELRYEEYAQLFIAAGYDLPTIARMTPEDLTAVGIRNPQHREHIKKQIDKLQLVDNLPDFVPGSIEEWLRILRLEEYTQPILDQKYKSVRDVTQVTWEDLEDIGIVKLGHQKKILLAIKRVKDILSGKRSFGFAIHQQNRQPRGKSLESLEDFNEINARQTQSYNHYTMGDPSYFQIHPSILGKTIASVESGNPYPVEHLNWRRSYDDGDITPTNEISHHNNHQQGGGTLPRQRNSNLCRSNRALSAVESSTVHANQIQYNYHHCSHATDFKLRACNNVLEKKVAPDPPLRNCSIRNSVIQNVQPTDNLTQQTNFYQHKVLQHHTMHKPHLNQQHIPCSTMRHQQPIYVNFSSIHQTTAEIHNEKPLDNKSNSSIDSIDTIPFANENTGTIKQKLNNRFDVSSSLSLSSSSSASSTNTVSNITHAMISSATINDLSSKTCGNSSIDESKLCSSSPVSPNKPDSINVLNDIGNMLANLTDELDAMLEEEKRVGINDSE